VVGRAVDGLHVGTLDDLAGVHDDDLVRHLGHDAEVVGDEHDRHPVLLAQAAHELEDLRLDRDVERGGRLVGDQQVGVGRERHGDHHALAHAAGQLVRILLGAPSGVGDADEAEHLDGAVPRLALGPGGVLLDGLRDLLPAGEHRVQARHRLLEDHAHLVATDVAHLGVVPAQQILAVEQDLAVDDLPRALDEPHDRQARDALPAAGLADDAERLSMADLEGHAIDGFDRPVPREEMGFQAPDLEEGACVPRGNRHRISTR
jgi:hypothetical protein